ncbi:MAG TPA: hypothetical protein VMY79_03115 [Dehalococcoidia bacterium]|nr:hypothetical protein [Dehalococcoidia bacterium]
MKELIHKANVVYVCSGTKVIDGVDTGRDAIVVGVTKKVSLSVLKKGDRIPTKVHGKETDVVETGEIKALRTSKHRPAPGGVSIGHPNITAGTLGMVIPTNSGRYILSNNHVLANSNDASIGDETWQPGAYDGGVSIDVIGHLSDFVPIVFLGGESTCPIGNVALRIANFILKHTGHKFRVRSYQEMFNLVDCAIAKPINDSDVSEEILEVGIPIGFSKAIVGEKVKKSGRTSGLTEGTVSATDALVNVNYGDGKMATFTDQIMTTAMSEGGDSGSVVLNEVNEVVGLLFAGSDQVTIVNKISNVLKELGLA